MEHLSKNPLQVLLPLAKGYRVMEDWPFAGTAAADRVAPDYLATVYRGGRRGVDYAEDWIKNNTTPTPSRAASPRNEEPRSSRLHGKHKCSPESSQAYAASSTETRRRLEAASHDLAVVDAAAASIFHQEQRPKAA